MSKFISIILFAALIFGNSGCVNHKLLMNTKYVTLSNRQYLIFNSDNQFKEYFDNKEVTSGSFRETQKYVYLKPPSKTNDAIVVEAYDSLLEIGVNAIILDKKFELNYIVCTLLINDSLRESCFGDSSNLNVLILKAPVTSFQFLFSRGYRTEKYYIKEGFDLFEQFFHITSYPYQQLKIL